MIDVTEHTADQLAQSPPAPLLKEPATQREGSVRWVALLLGVQVLLHLVLATYYLLLAASLPRPERLTLLTLPGAAEGTYAMAVVLLAIAAVGVVAVGGFLFNRLTGWVAGMTMQATTLLFCLTLYWRLAWRPGLLFPLMAYSIVMVLYLNSSNVRMHFQPTPLTS